MQKQEINKKLKESNFFNELIMLIGRNLIVTLRNKKILISKLVQLLVGSLLVCLLWYNVKF